MSYGEIARWSVVASSLFFAILIVWGFRKLAIPAITAAQEAKNQEIAMAELRLQQMKVKAEELRAQLASADLDAQAIRQRSREQAQREREAAVQEAKLAGERALRNAEGELGRARIAAGEALREDLLNKALQLARTGAAEKSDRAVNAKLVDRFIDTIERGALN